MHEKEAENQFKQMIPYFARFQNAILDAMRKGQPGSYRVGIKLKPDGNCDVEIHLNEQSTIDFRHPDPDIRPE